MAAWCRFEDDDWPMTRPTSDGRPQRAARRQRTDPVYDDHIRASSRQQIGDDRLTPTVTEDDVDSQNVDDQVEHEQTSQSQQGTSHQLVRDRRVRQARRLIRRNQAYDEVMRTKRGSSRRVETEPVLDSVIDSFPQSVTKPVLLVQRQRSPGVRPKSTSSERLNQETSSSSTALTLGCNEHPTDLTVSDGLSSDSVEPTVTDTAACLRVDCDSTSSVQESSCDDLHGVLLQSENNEDQKKSTSGAQLDGVQTAVATDPDSSRDDQTSSDAVMDVDATQEDGPVPTEILECDMTSGRSDVEATGQADDKVDDAVVQCSSSAEERSRRTSVMVSRRRRIGKTLDTVGRRPADLKAKSTASCVVPVALYNGIKPHDDCQASDSHNSDNKLSISIL